MRRAVILAVLLGLSAAGNARAAFNFSPSVQSPVPVEAGPLAITSGDLDGDARPDLVTANFTAATGSVLLGNGSGGFAPAMSVPAETGAAGVAIGDLNGDAKPDVVIANALSNSISVRMGDGQGGFSGGSAIPVGSVPVAVAIGSFNAGADSLPDLAVANLASDNVSVLLGDGSGGFTAAGAPVTVGDGPAAIATGRLDDNGAADLVTVNRNAGSATVLVGDATGGFSNAVGSPVPVGSQPNSLLLQDLDRDERLDLVTANVNTDTVSVLLGDGNAGFGAAASVGVGDAPQSVAVADLDSDDDPDLAVANRDSDNVTVLFNDRFGGFTALPSVPLGVGDGPVSITASDLNRDDKPDLAAATNIGSSAVTVLLNTSSAERFVSPTALAFGEQPAGTRSAALTSLITSAGHARLRVTRVRTTGPDASDFLVAADDCTAEPVLVGDVCRLSVRFVPSSAGTKTATLQIVDNAGAPATVSLGGTGGAAPVGPPGPPGPTGGLGPAGQQGPPGPQGPAGAANSAAGAAGAAGQTGATGAAGPTGPRGPQGSQGTTGPAGAPETVSCRVKQPRKKGGKVKVICSVRTAGAATAQLRQSGRTRATRRLRAGARRVVFRLHRRARGPFTLRVGS